MEIVLTTVGWVLLHGGPFASDGFVEVKCKNRVMFSFVMEKDAYITRDIPLEFCKFKPKIYIK